MLFHSPAFLFFFLPVALVAFSAAGRIGRSTAIAAAALASLFFYAWWSAGALALLLGSVLVNYLAGLAIVRAAPRARRARLVLAGAIAFDLLLLAYFKYADFFLGAAPGAAGLPRTIAAAALPLGISFFTFTQIGFLVDAWRGNAREYRFMNYLLFVSYFPHLIAGPILHHAEMMPQFERETTPGERAREIAAGLTLFVIGLFKKVVIADGVGAYVAPVFDAPSSSVALTVLDAWGGALAYAMQLYFDFSGYSDMALGISLLFGIRLPLNFDSPYKAASLIDFWRRWHMTLARFLREYLYVPLGGNRRGEARRYANIMLTMVLGGVWHGAGWTFALWGAYHGVLLCLNHAWRSFLRATGRKPDVMPRLLGVALTFLAVLAGWVLFRAASIADALVILRSMTMVHEIAGAGPASRVLGLAVVPWLLAGSIIVWGLPNAYQILAREHPALADPRDGPARLQWRPSVAWAAFATVLLVAVLSRMHAQSSFLYFQF